MTQRFVFVYTAVVVLVAASFVLADTAAFDLSGPRVEVTVSRAGKTLPVSEVPNLQAGDRLWLHPDLPPGQSVHYLLVAAFLRGSTNPPPDNWFTKVETWNKQVREEGVVVTVPKDAQQALLFLAPETGGDFSSLRSAVQGKPGAFVRASQDLNQASLDRLRLQKYLDAAKEMAGADPKVLHDRSVLLARSLSIKLDQSCFDKPSQEQVPCLTQNTDQLVLDDQHSQSMVATLSSGPASDLIGNVSSTPLARGGYYSPYVGAVVDMARIMGSFRTPEYQYIPALAQPRSDELNLKLNNPPSFRKPKSVLVIGLPAVEDAQLPPLRAVDSGQASCLQSSSLVLATEGAPLVFATGYAHSFVLHIAGKSQSVDLPATADPARGGFVIDTRGLQSAKLDPEFSGTLRGYWGFQAFDGPSFPLRSAHPARWTVASPEPSALIVGREQTLHLQSDTAACVEGVTAKDSRGKLLKAAWHFSSPDELELQLPLQDAAAGMLTLSVKQAGLARPDEVPLQTYSEAAHLERFALNTGDPQGILEGSRLEEVASLDLKDIRFTPTGLTHADQKEELRLAAANAAATATLRPDDTLIAQVTLKDGRVLQLQTTVESPRPRLTLISKNIEPGPEAPAIRLSNPDDLAQGVKLSFFVKSEVPETFPRNERIEVAAVDDSFHVLLDLKDGNLTLQDARTVLAVVDPLKDFGHSAFGPMRFRPVDADGASGAWEPLANLVRIPSLKEIRCPDNPDKACTLSGSNLFLIDSVAANPQFTHAVAVPLGFAESTLSVPRPNGTLLYIKLRDDPSVVNPAALPVLPEGP